MEDRRGFCGKNSLMENHWRVCMLRFNNQLLFPTLKKISLHSLNKSLFNLNWEKNDLLKKDHWENSSRLTSDSIFPGTLPKKYKDWVDTMVFAISNNLLEEIRYCSLKASEEWGRKKPEYWEPLPLNNATISYIMTAFNLIADCLYDLKTENFSRDERKAHIPYILAYRFWIYQIKPEKLEFYSGFNPFTRPFPATEKLNIETELIEDLQEHAQILKNKKVIIQSGQHGLGNEKVIPNKKTHNKDMQDAMDTIKRSPEFVGVQIEKKGNRIILK
jgi:hypothetical protein